MDWKTYAARVIIALDPPLDVNPVDWSRHISTRLVGLVAGFKLGLPLLTRAGYEGFRKIVSGLEGLRVADFKLADITPVMWSIVEPIVDVVDAVIAHAFIGYEGALSELREKLAEYGVNLILVYHMSHPGARETFGKCIAVIDTIVEKVKPWGLVAPATMPEVIEAARRKYNDIVILSPGVGVQGARPGTAICSGADYEIVGRAVTRAHDPLEALRSIATEGAARISECRATGF